MPPPPFTLGYNYCQICFFFTFSKTQNSIKITNPNLEQNHLNSFHRAAPPHSYLHVDQFTSPDLLAKELERLSRNATAYNEYFWWQKFYKLVKHDWHIF
jgi:hypothetical protein